MTAVEILRGGKQRLIDNGWLQGRYLGNSSDACCMLGACAMAERGYPGDPNQDVMDLLRKATNFYGAYLFKWNGAPGRTVEEVLAAFDRAIELAEKGQ